MSNNEQDKRNQEIARGTSSLLLLVVLFRVLSSCSSSPSYEINDSSRSDCYNRVSQELIEREGNKVVTRADIDRYSREFTSRCN